MIVLSPSVVCLIGREQALTHRGGSAISDIRGTLASSHHHRIIISRRKSCKKISEKTRQEKYQTSELLWLRLNIFIHHHHYQYCAVCVFLIYWTFIANLWRGYRLFCVWGPMGPGDICWILRGAWGVPKGIILQSRLVLFQRQKWGSLSHYVNAKATCKTGRIWVRKMGRACQSFSTCTASCLKQCLICYNINGCLPGWNHAREEGRVYFLVGKREPHILQLYTHL